MASDRQLRRRVRVVGTLLIAAFVGAAAWDGWRLYQQIMAANDRELLNLSRALASECARGVQAEDVLVAGAVAWIERGGATEPPAAIAEALAGLADRAQIETTLTVVDRDGRELVRSRPVPHPLGNVSHQPWFESLANGGPARLVIAPSMDAGSPDVNGLVLARRVADRHGAFAGVVAARVSLGQLRASYAAIDLGGSSSLMLTMDDGTLVLRQPALPAGVLRRIHLPDVVAVRSGAPIHRMVSPIDGRTKLIAAVGVGDRPLILAVARDERAALQPWLDEMWSTMLRTLLFIGVTVAGMVYALRQLRRTEAASQALRESENRYAMAMEAANEGHAEWNQATGALFLSGRWRAMHGLDPGESIPTVAALRARLMLHPEDAPRVAAAVDDHLAGRSPAIEVDYRVRHRDGEWRDIHARGRCQRHVAGDSLSLFCSAVDITDRRRAEAQAAAFEARREQVRRLEALGTMAGGIAHDFNNILGAILGFGEMAQQRAEPGSALRRYVDRMMQSGARARLLVRRILDFSRSGVAERALVNVQSVLEEVVAMLAPSLPPGLRVEAHLDAGLAAVMGDATQLHQVAMNLATNAVQAMGDEGLLTVRLEREPVGAPRACMQGDLVPGDYVRLEVRDDGPGIPDEVLARIFDPFFTTKRSGGTGLGLSVVHGIVADLGGAIDVVSACPGGTTVSVWLPVAGERAPQASARPGAWPSGAGQTVMVVDDEMALVELAEELLAGLGYEPVGYRDAEAALAAFQQQPQRFDALLTDLALPGMSGIELARRLRGLRPALPVLLMSGNLGDADERAALDAGVRGLLHKPLTPQEMAERLAALFEA